MLSFENPKSKHDDLAQFLAISRKHGLDAAWPIMKAYFVHWYVTHVQLDPIRRTVLLLQCASLFMLKAQQHRDVPSSSASWPMRHKSLGVKPWPVRFVSCSLFGRWSVCGRSADSWLAVC